MADKATPVPMGRKLEAGLTGHPRMSSAISCQESVALASSRFIGPSMICNCAD